MLIHRNNEEVCSYPVWYPLFKNISLDSVLVPLSEEVFDYLLEDSTLVLPEEACISVEQEGENDALEITQPTFPAFSKAISQALASLGGEVFVKLNWTAPVDAAWITSSKSLKCTSIEDVYLLLKSSDILAKELAYIKQTASASGYLVIKRWYDIYPGDEFRCFVIRHKLVGISQRDYKTYYGYLAQNKFAIIEDIDKFFTEKIKGKFLTENYTFDIVRKSRNGIKVIDFGPFDSKKTKSLLFTWDELHELENKKDCDIPATEFRFLGEDPGFQPNPYQHYGLPQDFGNSTLVG